MASITLNLKAKMTKAEEDEANHLLAAVLTRDGEDVSARLDRPVIKRLLQRGALRLDPRNRGDD